MAKSSNNGNGRKGGGKKKNQCVGEKSAVLFNWPGFYDVFNRPRGEKEKKEFIEGMTMEGRGHEVIEYQLGIESYELSLKKFLADIKRNDRYAPEEFGGMIKKPKGRKKK